MDPAGEGACQYPSPVVSDGLLGEEEMMRAEKTGTVRLSPWVPGLLSFPGHPPDTPQWQQGRPLAGSHPLCLA